MISNKTNHQPFMSVGLGGAEPLRRNSHSVQWSKAVAMETPAEAGLQCLAAARRPTQLVHYRVLRVERTTTGDPVAMERYAAQDPMSAVEGARRQATEGAGGIAFLTLDRDGASSAIQEIIAIFGLRDEEARRLLSPG